MGLTIDANLRRINSGFGCVCIEVRIALVVILTL